MVTPALAVIFQAGFPCQAPPFPSSSKLCWPPPNIPKTAPSTGSSEESLGRENCRRKHLEFHKWTHQSRHSHTHGKLSKPRQHHLAHVCHLQLIKINYWCKNCRLCSKICKENLLPAPLQVIYPHVPWVKNEFSTLTLQLISCKWENTSRCEIMHSNISKYPFFSAHLARFPGCSQHHPCPSLSWCLTEV